MLQPKKVKYRRIMKGRRRGTESRATELAFGDFGLKTLERAWLNTRALEAARIALTRYIKRGGRVWVAEAYCYPIRRPDKEANDRIVIFEDTDGDGHFDKRTVFMEGLNLVSGLEVGHGGVWIGAAPYLMFVPFKDATSGHETYGGGRYLLDTIKSADLGSDAATGTVVLDFNFAYHPSCTYDPQWVCPLAPPDSRLALPIRAGERLR